MKNIIVLLTLFLFSCSSGLDEDKEKFINTQKEILVVRILYPDTSVANPKVNNIYKKYGFTKESFKVMYFELASNHEEFLKIMDTARTRARKEISKIDKARIRE